jgi:hypothetical protein
MWALNYFLGELERKVFIMAEQTTTTNTSTDTSQDVQNASQDTKTTSATVNSTETKDDSQANSELSIEELIQRAVDRATNKIGNENKKLRESLTKLQKEKLTADEQKEFALQQREADLADREAQLKVKTDREFALNAIKEIGLDDGSKNSLELIDFVVCDNEKDTLARVKAFDELVKKFVKAEVDKTFKANGRNPNSSTTTTDDSLNTSNVAELLGKLTAEQQKETNDILSQYLGGK